jgi:hypothetical protein
MSKATRDAAGIPKQAALHVSELITLYTLFHSINAKPVALAMAKVSARAPFQSRPLLSATSSTRLRLRRLSSHPSKPSDLTTICICVPG